MSITLYGLPGSPFVRKVQVILEEKGLEYTQERVSIFPLPDWFKEISPLRRIPVLKDDGGSREIILPDSSAIGLYLERQYPDVSLCPDDPCDLGEVMWFEEYGDTELIGNIGNGVFRPIVIHAMMNNGETDQEKADKTMKEKLPANFAYLEEAVTGKEFIVGSAFSMADIAIVSPFINLRHAGYTPDADKYPSLVAYVDRICQRPSFAKAIEEEKKIFTNSIA